MKALVFSDVHGQMDAVRHLMQIAAKTDCDFGLFCGDIVKGYARGDEFLAAKNEGREGDLCKPEIVKERAEDYALYAEFHGCLRPSPFPIYGVPGNMDAPEGRYLTCSLAEEGGDSPLEVVHRSLAKHDDYVISGLGGQITEVSRHEFLVLQYPGWEALHQFRLFEYIAGPRIMVLHTPPIGKVVDIDNGGHKGSQVVNELIHTFRPKLAVCGHAHDAQGQETIADTLVVNPGALKEGNYAIVDLEEMEVDLRQL
jgi:uncharacterized protein